MWLSYLSGLLHHTLSYLSDLSHKSQSYLLGLLVLHDTLPWYSYFSGLLVLHIILSNLSGLFNGYMTFYPSSMVFHTMVNALY